MGAVKQIQISQFVGWNTYINIYNVYENSFHCSSTIVFVFPALKNRFITHQQKKGM